MKASHLSSYVIWSLRFPKMVVGTLGNVWDSYSANLKVRLVSFVITVRLTFVNK